MGFFDLGLGDIVSGVTGLISGNASNNAQKDNASNNIAEQRDFAQNGVKWRVADAKAAGISPLAALGANLTSFSPVEVGDSAGTGLARFGQDISRSMNATRTAPERAQAKLDSLSLEHAGLENDLLRAQIAKLNAAPNPPFPSANDAPIPGQGDSYGLLPPPSSIDVRPSQSVAVSPSDKSSEAAVAPSIKWQRGSNGEMIPAMSQVGSQGSGDIWEPATLEWWARNRILPAFGFNVPAPPPVDPGAGRKWMWFGTDYRSVPARQKDWSPGALWHGRFGK